MVENLRACVCVCMCLCGSSRYYPRAGAAPAILGMPQEGGGVLGWGMGRGRPAQLTVPSLLCPSGEQGLPGFSASGKC